MAWNMKKSGKVADENIKLTIKPVKSKYEI